MKTRTIDKNTTQLERKTFRKSRTIWTSNNNQIPIFMVQAGLLLVSCSLEKMKYTPKRSM